MIFFFSFCHVPACLSIIILEKMKINYLIY